MSAFIFSTLPSKTKSIESPYGPCNAFPTKRKERNNKVNIIIKETIKIKTDLSRSKLIFLCGGEEILLFFGFMFSFYPEGRRPTASLNQSHAAPILEINWTISAGAVDNSNCCKAGLILRMNCSVKLKGKSSSNMLPVHTAT